MKQFVILFLFIAFLPVIEVYSSFFLTYDLFNNFTENFVLCKSETDWADSK